MTYAGAADQTEAEMAETMHYTLDQARLHGAINGLDLLLSQQGETSGAVDASGFRLNTANSLWGQKGSRFPG
jgi:serpin B